MYKVYIYTDYHLGYKFELIFFNLVIFVQVHKQVTTWIEKNLEKATTPSRPTWITFQPEIGKIFLLKTWIC